MKTSWFWLAPLLSGLVACSNLGGGTTGGNPLTEDDSASGAVAQAVGGALSSSSSNGTQAFYKYRKSSSMIARRSFWDQFNLLPRAWAGTVCPTFMSSAPYCTASGSKMTLYYNTCSYPASSVTWTGYQDLTMSTGTAACGTFPNPGAGNSLYRQYVNGSGTASHVLLKSAYGTTAAIDNGTADLGNFDGQTIATLTNGGYGTRVDFDGSGHRSHIELRERVLVSGAYDHSIVASMGISDNGTSQTINGTTTVYLNGVQVIGTSTITNLVHDDMCCQPISGTIQTAFTEDAAHPPTALGLLLVGKSETLTFTGCGTGQLTKYDGSIVNVSLSRCF